MEVRPVGLVSASVWMCSVPPDFRVSVTVKTVDSSHVLTFDTLSSGVAGTGRTARWERRSWKPGNTSFKSSLFLLLENM